MSHDARQFFLLVRSWRRSKQVLLDRILQVATSVVEKTTVPYLRGFSSGTLGDVFLLWSPHIQFLVAGGFAQLLVVLFTQDESEGLACEANVAEDLHYVNVVQ